MESNHFINGEWCGGEGEPFQSKDAVTHSTVWTGKAAIKSEIEMAVRAAKNAFPGWAKLPIGSRIHKLNHFHQILSDNKTEMASSISISTGKPLWESYQEVGAMLGKIPISIDAYEVRTGVHASTTPQGCSIVRHRPMGVLGVIGPFNFPGHLPNGHIIPALLAGNTVVYKCSELTPLVGETMMQLWEKVGLPPGVLNMVQGGRETGEALSGSPIDGLLFTGSVKVGQALHRQFQGSPEKILALEMGGNNPLLVFDCDNLDAAVYTIIQSTFITAGQRCTAARRLILPDNAFGQHLLSKLVQVLANIKVDRFSKTPEPFMGPVITPASAALLVEKANYLQKKGGEVLLPLTFLKPNSGLLSPGLIDMTTADLPVDEELFGPLLQIYRVKSFEAALEKANDTRFGLAAGLLSDNPKLFDGFYENIAAGIINWNCPTTGALSQAPFGGVGVSGNHRPSAFYAADYCAYPVASIQKETLALPETLLPGIPREAFS